MGSPHQKISGCQCEASPYIHFRLEGIAGNIITRSFAPNLVTPPTSIDSPVDYVQDSPYRPGTGDDNENNNPNRDRIAGLQFSFSSSCRGTHENQRQDDGLVLCHRH